MQEKFLEYTKDLRLLDMKMLEKFTDYYVEKLKLKKVVSDIQFVNNGCTCYNQYDGYLIINLYQLYDFAISGNNTYGEESKEFEIYFSNLDLLSYLLHEIMHAKQMNIITRNEPSCDLVRKALCEGYDRLKYSDLYKFYHDYFLIEHHANTLANIYTHEFSRDLDSFGFDYHALKHYLKIAYTKPKNVILSPIERESAIVQKPLDKTKILNSDDYKYLTEFEKVIYGLPIGDKTYEKIKQIGYKKTDNIEKHINGR
jgi:hypothetical protein